MASSKSRALTRDIILSAALELVDDAGLSALSLLSLGTTPPPPAHLPHQAPLLQRLPLPHRASLPRQSPPGQIQTLIPSLTQSRLPPHKQPLTRPCRRRNIFASTRTACAPLCKITPTRSFC